MPELVIERNGRTVTLELTCPDLLAAIELHERLVAEARRAGADNVVSVRRSEHAGEV